MELNGETVIVICHHFGWWNYSIILWWLVRRRQLFIFINSIELLTSINLDVLMCGTPQSSSVVWIWIRLSHTNTRIHDSDYGHQKQTISMWPSAATDINTHNNNRSQPQSISIPLPLIVIVWRESEYVLQTDQSDLTVPVTQSTLNNNDKLSCIVVFANFGEFMLIYCNGLSPSRPKHTIQNKFASRPNCILYRLISTRWNNIIFPCPPRIATSLREKNHFF